MIRRWLHGLLILGVALLCPATAWADHPQEPTWEPGNPAAGADAGQVARNVLAQFDRGVPGWKVRMEALIRLVKAGSDVVPVLVEALRHGPPPRREFAAQALAFFADPRSRRALEQAVTDPKPGVRLYAVQALSMMGRLTPAERYQRILDREPSVFGVQPMLVAAMARTDRPDAGALRKALADYDLRNLDRARLGQPAPDFTLRDYSGKTVRLSQFRGKQAVVLRFALFDY